MKIFTSSDPRRGPHCFSVTLNINFIIEFKVYMLLAKIRVLVNDFTILGNNYQLNIKRKISESLFIRQLKPTLNANEKSIPLCLFN